MRVDRTFAFVDLCGFTRFTDAQGDEESVRVLTHFRTAVRESATDFGVRVAKWLGDGAMFVGVQTEPLVAAIVGLEADLSETVPLPLRGGIAAGAVIVFEGDDYTGSAVNLAARLCDLAGPHEVLCTPDVAALRPAGIDALPVGEVDIKGLVHRVSVVRLTAHPIPEPLPEIAR